MKKRALISCMLMMAFAIAFGQAPKDLVLQIKKSKQDTNLVNLQLKLGNYYLMKPGEVKGDLDSALLLFNEALQLSDQQHAPYLHIRALKSIANTYLEAKDRVKAMGYIREAALAYRILGNKVQEATCWLIITNYIGVPDEAEKASRQAILVIETIAKSDPKFPKLAMDLGKYYLLKPGSEKEDMDNAFRYLTLAEKATALLMNDLRAQVLTITGNYYIEAGELEKGRGYFTTVLVYYQKKGDKLNEAATWGLLGDLFENNGMDDHKKDRRACYEKAVALYQQINHPEIAVEYIKRMAYQSVKLRDIDKARAGYTAAADYYHSKNDKLSEAEAWGQFALGLYEQNNFYSEMTQCYERQRELLHDAGKKTGELEASENIAQGHILLGKYAMAENELLKLVPKLKAEGSNMVFFAYDLLAQMNKKRGNQLKELSYRLASVKELEKLGTDSYQQRQAYVFAIITYNNLNMYDKGFEMALKLRKVHKGSEWSLNYLDVLLGTQSLVQGGKLKEAYNFLTSTTQDYSEKSLLAAGRVRGVNTNLTASTLTCMQSINEAWGMYYNGMGESAKAEKHYLAALNDYDVSRNAANPPVDTYLQSLLINFYLRIKDYKKANYYLRQIKSLNMTPTDIKKNELGLFKVDSAAGNYLSAINHLKQYQKNTDSLFSFTRDKKVMDMEIAFETRHKQDVINALQTQSKLQELKYIGAETTRNWIISLSAILLLLLGVVYNRFRLKQRSNLLLESKQKEINFQNEALQVLVNDKDKLLSEKDGLLIEKDWLLKEVHHRVKNNLQIVMSLLNSQSAYLENNAAIEAIRNSQSRVQAISLIHQKLYTSSNVASINMQAYVADLVIYLTDCFDTRSRHIQIEQVVETFYLDISQAVPLGLILNESVTNAIKYAFDNKGGQIIIAAQLIRNENLLLTIADNGKGLPENFNLRTASSLGMEMMKALSKQLGGEFKIRNNSGVSISIEFQIANVMQAIAETALRSNSNI